MFDLRSLQVRPADTVRETMKRIDAGGLGMAFLVDTEGTLLRTVTDGDLRRLLLEDYSLDATLSALGPQQPKTVTNRVSRTEAKALMDKYAIDALPVVDEKHRVSSILTRAEVSNQILLSTPHMGEDEQRFVQQAFETNWIAPLGPNVDEFERELAEVVDIPHAAALSSGTAAIHLALRLLDVGPGDTVFCSSLTFAASANPIVYQGAAPVFVDSERDSWNMCPQALERAFELARKGGRMPAAVIVVNLYGQSADMDPILELCTAHGVPVVEDAAESLGATYKGQASGTFGRFGIYSFNGNKIITTSGGGMLISRDEHSIARARFLATQARDPAPHYEHSQIGYNYRMSNILAGVGRGQLHVLHERVQARRDVFDHYRAILSDIDEIEWMNEPAWSRSTRWLSVGLVGRSSEDRDRLLATLRDDFVEARPVWKPMHLQPVFDGCDYVTAANQSISDDLFRRGVCFPSGSNMTDRQLDRITDSIRRFFRTAKAA